MSLRFLLLIVKVSIEVLVALYVPAVPKHIKDLFSKKTWTPDDFLALLDSLPECPGIYGDFLAGEFKNTMVKMDVYVGSTARTLPIRTGEHRKIAACNLEHIKKFHPGSIYYPEAHRPNVHHNFRELASFSGSLPDAYLKLLEALFTLWLGSMRKPTYKSRYGTTAAWELMASIRSDLHLPPIEWKGLNAACPFNQGFFNEFSRVTVPCVSCREAAEPGR